MTIRVPRLDFQILPATKKVINEEQKVLFVGQMTSAGSAASGALYENIGVDNEQDALFGGNSMLATMIRAFRYYNKVSRIDAIPLDDATTSDKSEGEIVFTGSAEAAGEITITVGGNGSIQQLSHVFKISVLKNDTATQIGEKLKTAVNADSLCPITAVNTSGSVVLTAVNSGTEANSIGLAVAGKVEGIEYALAGMTGGASDPVLTNLFDVIHDIRYQTVVYPDYVRDTAKAFLDSRFNADKKILDGVGISVIADTASNIITEISGENSQSICVFANKKYDETYYKAPSIFEQNTIIASQIAGIRALRLTTGENITRYISATYGSKDAIGGMHIASLPYFNTVIPALHVEPCGKYFTDAEQDALITAGASILGNNVANTNIILGTTVTTYKTDISGEQDNSFRYLEYVDTVTTCREYLYRNIRQRFLNSRLSDGNARLGYNMATSGVIASYIAGLYNDLANEALVKAGRDPVSGADWAVYFSENLDVALNLETGVATVTMLLPIVTQLRAIELTMQVSFSANS